MVSVSSVSNVGSEQSVDTIVFEPAFDRVEVYFLEQNVSFWVRDDSLRQPVMTLLA